MKGVYVFLADGFEDIEALAPVDVLLRGGIDVKTVSIYADRKEVRSAHNITVAAMLNFKEFLGKVVSEGTGEEDVMVFPGGMPGASNLAEKKELMDLMLKHYADGGSVAAICAAPSLVLSKLPDIRAKKMTCYEGMQQNLIDLGVKFRRDGVVTDGRVISGRGPGLAIAFGLGILAHVEGKAAADNVAKQMML